MLKKWHLQVTEFICRPLRSSIVRYFIYFFLSPLVYGLNIKGEMSQYVFVRLLLRHLGPTCTKGSVQLVSALLIGWCTETIQICHKYDQVKPPIFSLMDLSEFLAKAIETEKPSVCFAAIPETKWIFMLNLGTFNNPACS